LSTLVLYLFTEAKSDDDDNDTIRHDTIEEFKRGLESWVLTSSVTWSCRTSLFWVP